VSAGSNMDASLQWLPHRLRPPYASCVAGQIHLHSGATGKRPRIPPALQWGGGGGVTGGGGGGVDHRRGI